MFLLSAVILAVPFKPSVEVHNEPPVQEGQMVIENVMDTPEEVYKKIDELAPLYGLSSQLVKRIIYCESRGNVNAQLKNRRADGSVWSTDRGPFQVNDYYHKDRMIALGLDIDVPEDNIEYGLTLMREQGTQPWNWSKHCWDK